MSNQDGTSRPKEEDQAQQRRLYDQFETAKKFYAAHRLLVNAPPLDGRKIETFLKQALIDFKAAGGEEKTGIGAFGQSGPALYLENGEYILYDAGKMLAENYISSGVFR